MKRLYTVIVYLLLGVYSVNAQHQHQNHIHSERNEVGVSTGPLYAIDDKSWGTGVHLHYFRTLGAHSRWAIGGFIEQAWLDDTHFSVGAGAKLELIERFFLGAFPGITFAKHHHDHTEHIDSNGKTKAKFSMHVELVYDLLDWNKFHLGPVLDYSWSNNDSHTTFGVHVAFCF